MDFRENLLDRMIRIYGFENPLVIEFANACNKYVNSAEWDKTLETIVKSHEETPYIFDEEE